MHQQQQHHHEYEGTVGTQFGGTADDGYLDGEFPQPASSRHYASIPSLPPLAHDPTVNASANTTAGAGNGPDLDFYHQYQKQSSVRRKYERQWEKVRENMRSEGAEAARPAASKQRRQPPKPPDLFNHIVLNKDPEVSKYLPYDSIAFPKIKANGAGPTAAAEVETLWISGVLDHGNQSQVKTGGAKLGPFLALPGPGILPKARDELKKLDKKRSAQLAASANYSPRFAPPKSARARLSKKETVAQELAELESANEAAHHHQALTRDEVLDLNRIVKSLEPVVVKTNYQRSMDVYARENAKIRRALKGAVVPTSAISVANNDDLNAMFDRTRVETLNAIVVQRFWKRYMLRQQWKLRARQAWLVRRIQCLARGVMTRRLVAAWYQERLRLAIQWEARIRGALRIANFKRRLAREIWAVKQIQRALRGFLGRQRFVFLRRFAACLPIQRLWRGCVARAEADLRWLHPRATAIQVIIRGYLARKRLGSLAETRDKYARKLQRLWRGYYARKVRDVKLFDRETMAREQVVAELASEATYALEKWHGLSRAYAKKQFEARIEDLTEKEAALQKEIHEVETNYMELNRQRRQISPRGISQGWREELNQNIVDTRKKITSDKLQMLFGISLKLRTLREDQAHLSKQVKAYRHEGDQLNGWREQEVMEGIARENTYANERAAEMQAKKVAHEKRRWQLHFFTPSGKPDKWRTAGKPWDARALAGQGKDIFCGGTTDIFAFNQSVGQLRMGSDASLQRIMSQVQTQNFLNEVASMDGLLKPLMKPLQQMQHPKPLWEEQAEAAAPPAHPWVPTHEELRLPFDAEHARPQDPTRPPKLPSYPSPRVLEAADTLDAAQRLAARRATHAAEVAAHQQETKASRNLRPDKAAREAGYDSRTAIYAKQPEPDAASNNLLAGGGLTHEMPAFEREKARRIEREATEAKLEAGRRKARTKKERHRPVVSRIPWTLLDELEAEKYKLKAEKALVMLQGGKKKT